MFALVASAAWFCGCPTDDDASRPDASCSMAVELGTGSRLDFAPMNEGERLEVIRGFQGFRMLRVSMRIGQAHVEQLTLSIHLAVDDGALDVDQRADHVPAIPGDPDSFVEGYLVFLNDVPASSFVGHRASLEVVARARCSGSARREVVLADDDACIDTTTVIPDASVTDIDIPDGSVACP